MRDKYFGSHELQPREEAAKISSNRSFGLVFAVFFALLAALSLWRGTERWPIWLSLACVALALALIAPQLLAPLNRIWAKLGLLIHHVVSPLFLALLFYGSVVPVGFLMRLSGKDPLQRRYEPNSGTYWIKRLPPGPDAASFKNQF
jgi:Saxitoxin biosynthesis operon protein SxtJ